MKYIKTFENSTYTDKCEYRTYDPDDLVMYIDKYNPGNFNVYKITQVDNVKGKQFAKNTNVKIEGNLSMIGRIENIEDESDNRFEYLYKLRLVTQLDIDQNKYNL